VKRLDLIWPLLFAAVSFTLFGPLTFALTLDLVDSHRYRAGFLFFSVLGALGEALAARFSRGQWPGPSELTAAGLLWGLFGLAAALVFWIFNGGVVMAQTVGLLPGGGYSGSRHLLTASLGSFFFTGPFFTSLFVNLGFVSCFLTLRRLLFSALALRSFKSRWPGLNQTVRAVDWAAFVRRDFLAIPLFRVPMMTVVFMLPQDLWLPAAAWLGAVLTGLFGLVERTKRS
jgi:hypothetical protein